MKLSVIIPALDDRVLLAASLPLVLAELERLDTERELIVVDDTGTGALEEWLKVEFPSVQCLVREVNGGFGVACLSGAEQARGEVLCFLNPDVCGFRNKHLVLELLQQEIFPMLQQEMSLLTQQEKNISLNKSQFEILCEESFSFKKSDKSLDIQKSLRYTEYRIRKLEKNKKSKSEFRI